MSLVFSDLSRVFNKITFEEILQGDYSIAQDLNNLYFGGTNKTIGEFYESTYKLLLKNYKNEYVFKNAIAQKIVIGRHKLADITFFDEFKVWDNFVDALVINGNVTAYEIKTEYDSYSRLPHQLNTYCKVFEFVNVVIPSKSYIKKFVDSLPKNIGIITLTDKNTLCVKREPTSNLQKLSQEMIFSCLRKPEYESFIVGKFGVLPDVKPVYMRSACLALFEKTDVQEVNNFFHKALKSRKPLELYKNYFSSIPLSLRGMMLSNEIKVVEKITKLTNIELY